MFISLGGYLNICGGVGVIVKLIGDIGVYKGLCILFLSIIIFVMCVLCIFCVVVFVIWRVCFVIVVWLIGGGLLFLSFVCVYVIVCGI